LKIILLNASSLLQEFIKITDVENKELIKTESHIILLKAVHNIIRPVIKIVDLETYNNIVNACFSQELNAKYQKFIKDKEAKTHEIARKHLSEVGILKNPELEYKVGILESVLQSRQGIMLVGDTYCGKSTSIEAVKCSINNQYMPKFKEFYDARTDEKIKIDEQARKSKDSEISIKLFRK
jgi:hypothetical protein